MNNNLSIEEQVQQCKAEIAITAKHLTELKYKLKALQDNQSLNVGIRWVDEIRKCLVGRNDRLQAVTINTIIFHIKAEYQIEEDRNMRNKVATTLSRLYKDGIVNKIDYRGKTLYGYAEMFDIHGSLKDKSKIIAL